MKTIILITLTILSLKLNAQCVRQISTNPAMPVNSADNLKLNNTNPFQYSPVNSFDWKSQFIPNSTYTLADIGYVTQKNPLQTAFFMSPFNYSQTNVDYLFLADGFDSDNKSADGWELVKVDVGYLADGTTLRNNLSSLPYFLLYNKYTGTLRFFGILRQQLESYKTVNVNIKLEKEGTNILDDLSATNLLSIGETIQPLDQKTKIFETSVRCVSPNANNICFWFDMPLAYDPCVCNNKSMLTFEFTFLDEASFTASGIINQPIVGPENGSKPKTIAGKSIKFVASVGKAVATGGASLRADDFDNALALAKVIPGMGQNDQQNIDKLRDYLTCGTDFFDKIMDASESWGDDKDKDKIENGKDLALAGLDFYSDFKKGCGDTKSGAQMVSSQLNISGKIESTVSISNSSKFIAVPGSTWSNNSSNNQWSNSNKGSILTEESYPFDDGGASNLKIIPEYPLYNEALGTMAFLKTPTMLFNKNNYYNVIVVPGFATENRTTYDFKLEEDIKYTFNPVMNLDNTKTKIKTRFMIKNNYNLLYSGFTNSTNNINTRINGTLNLAPLMGRYYSPLVDLKYISDMNFRLAAFGINTIDEVDLAKKVFIQFIITTESFNIGSNGLPIKNSFVFTIPVNLKTELASIFNKFNNDNLLQHGKFNTPKVFSRDENIYYDGTVFISSSLSSIPGKKVKIYASLGFVIESGADIGSDIELIIGLPPSFVGTRTHPIFNQADIPSFCNNLYSYKYEAKNFDESVPFTKTKINLEDFSDKYKSLNSIVTEVYPNPTTDKVFVNIFNSNLSNYTFTVMDITGKIIINERLDGEINPRFEIDLINQSNGIYIVTIYNGNELIKHHKIVKINSY